MDKKLISLVAIALLSTNVTFAQTVIADVHVKLTLAEGKTTYRIGEPIKVIMEFTADRDGYRVDTIPDDKQASSDVVSIAPEVGVNRWLDETMGRFGRDVFSEVTLTKTPTPVTLFLNDSLRFDRPGRYTVKVTTSRVTLISRSTEYQPPVPLSTNDVTFEVQPMSEDDEKAEVKRISNLLDAKRDLQTDENVTKQLSYLTGDVSSREKVRRFLDPGDRTGNYYSHLLYGLYIARNRGLVLQLLENAMRDPAKPVSSSLLGVASRLKQLRENNGLPVEPRAFSGVLTPTADPRLAQIQDAYVTELAAGLSKRNGKSQTTTAITILAHLPKDTAAASAMTREASRILVQQFDSLHPYDQEYLLRQYWEQLGDSTIVPSLKKMLTATGVASKNLHETALKRLIEIAPDEAHTYVVAEIRDPASLVDLEVLNSLTDKSLPEVDAALLEQIKKLAASSRGFDRVYLKHKASLAVRYATDGIYQELMTIYRENLKKLSLESRACLLAYAAKHNEGEAVPLIEQVLSEVQPGEDFNFLPVLTSLYYSEGIGSLVKKRLEGDEPQVAGNAAYLISKHGTVSDEVVLEKRLERWRKEWGDRVAEADANSQGMLERELIYGLIHSKAWTLSPERLAELRQSCLTKMCKQSVR